MLKLKLCDPQGVGCITVFFERYHTLEEVTERAIGYVEVTLGEELDSSERERWATTVERKWREARGD